MVKLNIYLNEINDRRFACMKLSIESSETFLFSFCDKYTHNIVNRKVLTMNFDFHRLNVFGNKSVRNTHHKFSESMRLFHFIEKQYIFYGRGDIANVTSNISIY